VQQRRPELAQAARPVPQPSEIYGPQLQPQMKFKGVTR
jgi:hypothetical protein